MQKFSGPQQKSIFSIVVALHLNKFPALKKCSCEGKKCKLPLEYAVVNPLIIVHDYSGEQQSASFPVSLDAILFKKPQLPFCTYMILSNAIQIFQYL